MTELLRAYHEIYKVKREYCVICLRPSEERRMVNIKTLERFIQSINLPFNYIDDFQKICYLCESAAAAAYRFRLAVNLSGAVHGLYLMMGRSRRAFEDIEKQIRGAKAQTGVVRNVPEWEARLRAVRGRSALLRSEVLVVNSVLTPGQNTEPPDSTDDAGTCEDIYLIPDATPAPSASPAPIASPAPSASPAPTASHAPPSPTASLEPEEDMEPVIHGFEEPEIYMESVVLVDDEVDPIEIKREEPLFDEMTIEETSVQTGTRCKNQTSLLGKPLILNSLLTSDSPAPSLVPIEKLIDSSSTRNLAWIPEEGIMQRNPAEPTNFLLHPIVEKDGVITVPSLAAHIVNGQLVTVDNSNVVIRTPKLALQNGLNFNLLTDPNQVTDLLKSMSNADVNQVTVVSDHISMDALEDNVMQRLSQNNVLSTVNVKSQGTQARDLKVASEGRYRRDKSGKDRSVAIRNSVLNIKYQERGPETDMFVPGAGMESIIIYDEDENAENAESDRRTQRKKEMAVVEGRKRQNETECKRSKKEGASEKDAPKQWETDWEDKIPTEVISTMDAVDPNAASVLANAPKHVISRVHSTRENVHSSAENVHSSMDVTPAESVISTENVHSDVFGSVKNYGRSTFSGGTMQVVHSSTQASRNVRGDSVTRSIRSLVESVQCVKDGSVQSAKTRLKPRVTIGVQKSAGGKLVADQSVCDIIDLS